MASQIELLTALQEIDQRLQKKEQSLQELRQQTTAILSEIDVKERQIEEEQQQIAQLEASHRATELQLREEEDKIKEKRVRLNRIRNDRELQALKREIDSMKEANSKLEDEGIQLLEQIEREKNSLLQTRTSIAELKAKIDTEAAHVNMQIAALEEERQHERNERERIAALIDVDLRVRYERIFAKRGGMAVVEIRAGTCQGCHMRIPPQMGNQILSNVQQHTGVVFHCPHCGRILISKLDQDPPLGV
ncbi:MAG: zinc ribbon domain-containing protein [Candidatus Binatia bacterium]